MSELERTPEPLRSPAEFGRVLVPSGRGAMHLLDDAPRLRQMPVGAHLGPCVMLVLASVPEAVGFYDRCSMLDTPHLFRFPRETPATPQGGRRR